MLLRHKLICGSLLGIMGGWPNVGVGEDWPHWMGPTRDNHWHANGILKEFPEGGPKVVWETQIAGGYSGPAVAEGRVILTDFVTDADVKVSNFDRREKEGVERVLCLDSQTGEQLWVDEHPTTYAISYPAGPRCTPIIHQGRVYALGAQGHLQCLELKSGEAVWSRELTEDFDIEPPLWGFSSHPLIDGDKLVCVVGGDGTHTVAFDKQTGEQLWTYGTASEQGYVPPSVVDAAGRRQLITASPDWIAAVDPETGEELWSESYEATSGSIIMTPVATAEHLFLGGYSKRNLMLKFEQDQPGVEVLFRDKPKVAVSPVNVQPFLEGDIMYGMDGDGALIAAKIPSGERLWETGQPIADRPVGSATAFIVKQGERFFLFTEQGDLVIAKLSEEGYTEIDRAPVIEPTNNAFGRPVVWCPPAYAERRMFVRNDEQCICIELQADADATKNDP